MKVIDVLKRVLLLFALFAGMTGCAMDSLQVMEYTESTPLNGTVEAKLTHGVIFVSASSIMVQDVGRDSIHLGIGIPEGWSVVSAQYYAAPHFRPIKYFSTEDGIDTAALEMALAESLMVFESRKQNLNADNNLPGYFNNREFTASDPNDNDTTLYTDDVAQWVGFSGLLDFNVLKGTPMDTFSVDSSENDQNETEYDTTGFSYLPVYLYLTLRAGSTNGQFPVFCYVKSDSMIYKPDSTSLIDIDKGAWAYFNVQVGNVEAEKLTTTGTQATIHLSSYPNPASGAAQLNYLLPQGNNTSIEIFSLTGALVRRIPVAGNGLQNRICWNGTNDKGTSVESGVYIARIKTQNRTLSTKIQFLRR